MDFQAHRPQPDYGDAGLSRLIAELKQRLIAAQDELVYDTLRLSNYELGKLAHIIIEFAEDVQTDLGLWTVLEDYNRQFFDTPLPMILSPGYPAEQIPFPDERICYLLWMLYPVIDPDLTLSPSHPDLHYLAGEVTDFLAERAPRLPLQSSLWPFLNRPNRYGWQVKQKLVWLGQHSYLFRYQFENFIQDHGGQREIQVIDDFICQETTTWSGLGAIDILAAFLSLSQAQQTDLRNWYERHIAYYRVERVRRSTLTVTNLLTDTPYQVRLYQRDSRFKPGLVILGGLIPWNGQWYWSGTQSLFEANSDDDLAQFRQTFLDTVPELAYRFDPARLARAQESLGRLQQRFLDTFGQDLVSFPNGRRMASAMGKIYRQYNERLPAEELDSAQPPAAYPPELVKHKKGVGVFFNPTSGIEMMTGFKHLVSGFKKQGRPLSEKEEEAIQSFIWSETISPQFVHRLAQEYGPESVATAFLIRNQPAQHCLDYLLRQYKGHFYRRRYPRITLA